MVNFQLQFVEKTLKGNDLYKVIGLEEEIGELELVIWDKEKFLEERPNYRSVIDEKEQYKFETLTSRLRCVWHSAQQVVDEYYRLHKESKTTNALLAGLKSDLNERQQRQKAANETIIGMGESVQKAQEVIIEIENITNEERERERERVIHNENGVRISEYDMERIVREYFRGDSLANIRLDWQEIIRETVNDATLPTYLLDLDSENSSILPTLQELRKNAVSNAIPLVIDVTRLILAAINFKKCYSKLNDLQKERLEKETKLRNWLLETATKNNNLKNKIATDPKLIVISYKIDMGEELSWFYVVTNQFNNHFGVNWSPLTLFSFLMGGLFGLIWLGYWFISRVKSLVRSRNTDNRENTHQD